MLSNELPCVLIYEITDFSTSHFARTIFHIIFQFTRVGILLSLSLSLYVFFPLPLLLQKFGRFFFLR